MTVRLKADNGQIIDVPEDQNGHFIWTAMKEFREAYKELTNLAHQLSDEQGGPCKHPMPVPQRRLSHIKAGPEESISLTQFADKAVGACKEMSDALRRAKLFAQEGKFEVYDDLIDAAVLGPRIDERGLRHYTIENGTGSDDPTSFVRERLSTIELNFGLNRRGIDGQRHQPYVSIPLDSFTSNYIDERGEPIMNVMLGDADLYDNEGEGDKCRNQPAQDNTEKP